MMTDQAQHKLCQHLRRTVLEQSFRAGVGHIGSALSVIEILVALHHGYLRQDPLHGSPFDGDRFILSKGHAALALYALLESEGRIQRTDLESYCQNASLFGVHPEQGVPGVEFATGSLGYGLPYACGLALGARLQGGKRRIAVLMSDAECNEGSVWESALFAAQHNLSNIVALIDHNQQQAFGKTAEVLNLSPLADKWRAFGWEVESVDGHDLSALHTALEKPCSQPKLILAETTFGKGVSFMEGQISWHYLPMSKLEYDTALAEVGSLSPSESSSTEAL